MFEIAPYLKRINYSGPVRPDLLTLRELHIAHMYAIPFENLNVHYRIPVDLNINALFDKVVNKKRGGFCYELNGLFAKLLQEIGFDVTLLSARVARAEGGYGPEFDHLVLSVKLDDTWLADVGFGDAFLHPLLLQNNQEQKLGADKFTFVPDQNRLVLYRCRTAQPWKATYSISLKPRLIEDFFDMCKFHASSPDSPFSKHIIMRLEKADGRLSLMDNRLSVISYHAEDQTLEFRDAAFTQMLNDYFGIVLDDPGFDEKCDSTKSTPNQNSV